MSSRIKGRKPEKPGERVARWVSRIVLGVFAIITVYPMIFMLLTSVKTTGEFYSNVWGLPENFAIENYVYAWDVASIGEYFFTSIYVVGIVVVVTLILSALAGYALAKCDIPHADLIMIVIFLLNMLPSESVLMPMYLLTAKMGILGTRLSLILPYVGWGLSFSIYIYRNFFKTIPSTIIEAARIDGCSEIRVFFRVVLPIMTPATATNAIFCFLGWWGELLWASVDLSTSSVKTLPMGITAFMQSFGTNWGPLSAASCIILIPTVIVFLAFQKYFISGITGGSVKG